MADLPHVLLVDDEVAIRRILSRELEALGLRVTTAESAAAARITINESIPDAIVLDVRMPGMSGDVFLTELATTAPNAPVIILTGHANVDLAVRCMRDGAFDLVTKPCSVEHLNLTIRRALENQQLRDTTRTLSRWAKPVRPSGTLVGSSPSMERLRQLIERVAPTDEPVLIVGESGTGKELIAREIVGRSLRAQAPFLTVNCAAVTETLLESELFGHEKGAFSGAQERRLGFFELAHEGTLFLDEIGDMPLTMQPKLLRVLQSGEFRRVGGGKTLTANVRIIAATNKNLHDEIREGRFREDLMHRVNTLVLEAPALRDRVSDLEDLIAYFLAELPKQSGRRFAPDAMEILAKYSWPGNIRELRNVVRRATILSDDATFGVADLPPKIVRDVSIPPPAEPLSAVSEMDLTLSEVERRHILAMLAECGGNKTAAARRLGVSTKTLYNKFEAWGMETSPSPDGEIEAGE